MRSTQLVLSISVVIMMLMLSASGHVIASSDKVVISPQRIPESSRRWADRILREASLPPTSGDSEMWRALLCDAEDAFRSILIKYGPDGRAYIGLARSQALQGKYNTAVMNYNRALSLLPVNPSIRGERAEAVTLSEIAESASTRLPKDHTILRVIRAPQVHKENRWLVLSARMTRQDKNWYAYSDIRLTLWEGIAQHMNKVRESHALGCPGYTRGEFNDLQLFSFDMNNDGRKDIVVPKMFLGASWSPSHIDVFEWKNDQLIHILGVSAEFPLDIRDLNRNGRYEVIAQENSIGWELSHATQPIWISIYAYKNGSYQLANGDFPWEYRSLYHEIRQRLADFPHDFELLKYLGVVHQIQRRPEAALRAFRRAEEECSRTLHSETDRELRSILSQQLADIRRLAQRAVSSRYDR